MSPQMTVSRALALSGWLSLSLMSGCVDGDPLSAPPTAVASFAVVSSVDPASAAAAATSAPGPLSLARLTVTDARSGAVLASLQERIEPGAPEWTFDVSLEVPADELLSVRVAAELASEGPAGAVVEWSGDTQPFEVRAGEGRALRRVVLYRGPLANLSVTGVHLAPPPSLVPGQSVALSARLDGGDAGARVYFRSLDTAVVSVADGRVQGVTEGVGRVEALAGRVADTVSVSVETFFLPPEEETRSVAAPLTYTTERVTGTMEDAAGAAAISSSLGSLSSAMAGGDPGGVVAAFDAARIAWERYGAGDPTLRVVDGPQLSVIELTLIHAADVLGIPF